MGGTDTDSLARDERVGRVASTTGPTAMNANMAARNNSLAECWNRSGLFRLAGW